MKIRRNRDLDNFYLLLALAVTGMLTFAIFLIGSDTLRVLALILVSGLVITAIIGVTALPIRAWRKNDAAPVVKHFYHDGTRTITRERERVLDGRTVEAPKLFQIPSQPQTAAFPELLRAAWQAGQQSNGPINGRSTPAYRELPAPEDDPDLDGMWGGDIVP